MDTLRITNALLALHKAIIDTERTNLERLEGRLTGAEMLRRLTTDERFDWLRPLTALVARFDDAESGEDVAASARQLLTPEVDADRFRTEYARLLQESPDVVMAHAAALGALRSGEQRPNELA